MDTDRLYRLITIFSFLGISLAVYLLIQQYTQPLITPCTISETVNCDAVISGPVAKTFGIPTPLIGLVGYLTIMFSALTKRPKLLLGMTTFGLLFCGWLGYVELFQLKVICPVCIGCQTIMLTVFLSALSIYKRSNKKRK